MWELRSSLAAEHGKLMAQDKELTILAASLRQNRASSWIERHSVRYASRGSTGVASAVGAAERHASKPRSK
jgi:hypothetical protein